MRVVRSSGLLITVLMIAMTACLDHKDIVATSVQMEQDIETIDNYLASNGINNAIKSATGIRYVITEMGTKGFSARVDQTIKAGYVGKFLDGTVFDPGATAAVGPLNGFIAGWQYALSSWPAGTKGKLFVPSPLGYGTRTVGSVPANSILTFDIDFQEVTYSNAEVARLESDITAIDAYLTDKKIDAVKDASGVRYVITQPGEGDNAQYFSRVKFTATGKQLTNGNQFFTGTSEPTTAFDSRVCDYIHGLQIAFLNLKKGGKMTVYIPSGLAFGPFENTASSLPANSNVIYDVELIDIIN